MASSTLRLGLAVVVSACWQSGSASRAPPTFANEMAFCVRNHANESVVLARSCSENETLPGGGNVTMNVSGPSTLWVVPQGAAGWDCRHGCPDCFYFSASALPSGAPALSVGFSTVEGAAADEVLLPSEAVKITGVTLSAPAGGSAGVGCIGVEIEGPVAPGAAAPLLLSSVGHSHHPHERRNRRRMCRRMCRDLWEHGSQRRQCKRECKWGWANVDGCDCGWIPRDDCMNHDTCARACREVNPFGPCGA